MKKLLLGIIAVLALQIGFVYFVAPDGLMETTEAFGPALEQPFPETDINNFPTRLPLPHPEGVRLAESRDIDQVPPKPEPDIRPTVRRSSTQVRSVAAYRKESVRPTPVPAQVLPTAYALQRPATIKWKSAAQEPVDRELQASVKNKSGKRSFFGKIIKKPYDWLKAIGSKLK